MTKKRKRQRAQLKPKSKPSLTLPAPGDDSDCVKKYLIQMRKIPAGVVLKLIHLGKIYEDRHRRCIFVSHDPLYNPTGAYIRGTFNILDKITNSAKGHDGTWGWTIGNLDHRGRLIVTESPIDAMSYMALYDPEAVIVALGGLNIKCLTAVTEWLQPKVVVVAVDNDWAGEQFRARCGVLLPPSVTIEHHRPKRKDWNEDLIWSG